MPCASTSPRREPGQEDDMMGNDDECVRMACAYPLHDKWERAKPVEGAVVEESVRVCAGTMILLGQAGRESKPLTLFCLGCVEEVAVTEAEFDRAKAAADAEHWTPRLVRAPLTVGALPEDVRLALFWSYWSTGGRKFAGADPETREERARESWAAAAPRMRHLGLLDDGGALTPEGLALQSALCEPPDDSPQHDGPPAPYVRPVRRVKKTRATAPRTASGAPAESFACVCGHSPGAHTSAEFTEACRACASVGAPNPCQRYRRAKVSA
jgi:hypothetical protein